MLGLHGVEGIVNKTYLEIQYEDSMYLYQLLEWKDLKNMGYY